MCLLLNVRKYASDVFVIECEETHKRILDTSILWLGCQTNSTFPVQLQEQVGSNVFVSSCQTNMANSVLSTSVILVGPQIKVDLAKMI